MKLKYKAVAAGLALGMVGVLSACGSPAGTTESGATVGAAPATQQGNATASMWTVGGGSEPMVRQSVVEWNEAHPDQQIEHEVIANDVFKERIRVALGSGNAPTIFHNWSGGPLAEYQANGQVVDMTDAASGLIDRVIPAVAANGIIDGKVYAVPYVQAAPVMFFYNRDVFEQAGVEVPTTWNELLDAVDQLKEAGVIPISLAAGSRWPLLMWIQYLSDRIGGPETFQAVLDGEPGAWSQPAMIEALTKIQELVDHGAFGDAFGSVMADQQADTALVANGNAAMVLQGAWAFPNMLGSSPEFVEGGHLGWFAFPTVEGGVGDPANLVGNPSDFLSISSSSSPEEIAIAEDYIANDVLNEERINYLLSIGAIPPVEGIRDQIEGLPNDDFLLWKYDLITDAPHFQLSWDQALDGARAQALLDNLSLLFLKQTTPEQFATTMDALQ